MTAPRSTVTTRLAAIVLMACLALAPLVVHLGLAGAGGAGMALATDDSVCSTSSAVAAGAPGPAHAHEHCLDLCTACCAVGLPPQGVSIALGEVAAPAVLAVARHGDPRPAPLSERQRLSRPPPLPV